MKIERLFEIIYILLDKKEVKAKELAERLEVSTRTIYRDIEELVAMGFPIYMIKGRNGGIQLMKNFALDKSLLAGRDQADLLTMIQTMNAIGYDEAEKMLKTLSEFLGKATIEWVLVELSSEDSREQDKFLKLKEGILNQFCLHFMYCNSYGQIQARKVEPIQLYFKQKTWYLKAYCLDKNQLRLFKLARIDNVTVTEESFNIRKNLIKDNSENSFFEFKELVRLRINKQMALRVYDEFLRQNIIENEGEYLIVQIEAPIDRWLIGTVLSYGDAIEVLEPPILKQLVKEQVEKMYKNMF